MTNRDLPLALIVDEVSPVVKLMQLELGFQGFRTESVLLDDGVTEAALSLRPDVIVVGSATPFPGVYEVLVKLKGAVSAPVLFIHAEGNDNDAALALQMGADDALGKPFLPEDLGFRLKALMGHELPEGMEFRRAGLRVDALRRTVWKGEQKLAIGTNEWSLLLRLAQTTGSVPAAQLLIDTWGPEYAKELKFLTVWVERLRINLGDDPFHPQMVLGDIESGFRLAE